MKEKMIAMLVGMLVKRLDAETFKVFADKTIDFVEDYVKDSPTAYDDAVMLPLCKTIRTAFNIPDDDE